MGRWWAWKVAGRLVKRMLALACGAAICACQTAPKVEPMVANSPSWTDEWYAFELPGKRSTRYVPVQFDSQWVLHAQADRSASMHRRTLRVESGPAHLGQWRRYTRDIAVDFRRAFGEEPGALIGIAVMTDTDNTQTGAEAWYGEIKLHVNGGVVW